MKLRVAPGFGGNGAEEAPVPDGRLVPTRLGRPGAALSGVACCCTTRELTPLLRAPWHAAQRAHCCLMHCTIQRLPLQVSDMAALIAAEEEAAAAAAAAAGGQHEAGADAGPDAGGDGDVGARAGRGADGSVTPPPGGAPSHVRPRKSTAGVDAGAEAGGRRGSLQGQGNGEREHAPAQGGEGGDVSAEEAAAAAAAAKATVQAMMQRSKSTRWNV